MDVFEFRDQLIIDYERFSRSFTKILAPDIQEHVDNAYRKGRPQLPAPPDLGRAGSWGRA